MRARIGKENVEAYLRGCNLQQEYINWLRQNFGDMLARDVIKFGNATYVLTFIRYNAPQFTRSFLSYVEQLP